MWGTAGALCALAHWVFILTPCNGNHHILHRWGKLPAQKSKWQSQERNQTGQTQIWIISNRLCCPSIRVNKHVGKMPLTTYIKDSILFDNPHKFPWSNFSWGLFFVCVFFLLLVSTAHYGFSTYKRGNCLLKLYQKMTLCASNRITLQEKSGRMDNCWKDPSLGGNTRKRISSQLIWTNHLSKR